MQIGPLITKNYSTVNAFHGIAQIKKDITKNGGALVVMDESKPLGIISAHDLAVKTHNLVIDCITHKPVISKTHLIPDVLDLMNEVNSDLLLVFDGDDMLGVIHKKDIMSYLCKKMEQQKSLVQSIAHDLKNPLSNILNVTYLMEDDGKSADNQELIGYAQEACRYANEIINDLLFSEGQHNDPLKIETVDLPFLLKECASIFTVAVQKKKIDLKVENLAGSAVIMGDVTKLKRAVSNLVSNAIKFTPDGGNIILSCESLGDYYLLKVKDSGIGIPPSLQADVFERFTKSQRQGTHGESSTGIGMYITRQIIEMHHGEIWFDSTVNKGTTFYIKLNNNLAKAFK